MGKLNDDPMRDIRVKQFECYIRNIFDKCKSHLGLSKYQSEYPSLDFNYNEDELMGGYFCHDLNEMEITYQGFDDSSACAEHYAKLVYHEFIHYHQSPAWFKRYYKYHGHDYLTHPYEVEAYGREHEILNLI
ncbi:MAG: hypothetical protein ACR2M7_06015 [Bdellovibrionales bacterium]